jgi:hypothetical protein
MTYNIVANELTQFKQTPARYAGRFFFSAVILREKSTQEGQFASPKKAFFFASDTAKYWGPTAAFPLRYLTLSPPFETV